MKKPLFGLFFLFLSPVVLAKATPSWESWVVSWDLERSTQAATRLGSSLSDIGLFAYHFTSDGHVIAATSALPEALAPLHKSSTRTQFWATLTNDRQSGGRVQLKDPAIMHTLLKKDARRVALIQELSAVARDVDGVEIDVENLWAKDRDAFSRFIGELAESLHAQKKLLAVVLQARTNDRIGDGAGAMDWGAIATAADRVKLMAYHFHHAGGEPGPVAPPAWVGQLARFAQKSIPSEKLSIVLTLTGFDWPKGGAGKSITYDDAISLSKRMGVSVDRDPATATPHFNYSDQGVLHTVWFEDANSLLWKISALETSKILRIAIWRLGTGDPAFWESLRVKTAR
jgi:spore germination protein